MGRARAPQELVSGRRLCVSAGLPLEGGPVTLDAGTARHARVLRLREGDSLRLFDGRGGEADARIVRLGPDAIECDAGPVERRDEPRPRVVLVQCMPKGEKLELIARMATELGVSAIHLATSDRAVARPDADRAATRLERLDRIVREAARQSSRAHVPDLVPPAPLAEVAARAPADAARVVPWERSTMALERALIPDASEAWVAIGPEGGLAEEEVARLARHGWADCSLGPTVLRVETAAPVAIALVRHVLAARDRS